MEVSPPPAHEAAEANEQAAADDARWWTRAWERVTQKEISPPPSHEAAAAAEAKEQAAGEISPPPAHEAAEHEAAEALQAAGGPASGPGIFEHVKAPTVAQVAAVTAAQAVGHGVALPLKAVGDALGCVRCEEPLDGCYRCIFVGDWEGCPTHGYRADDACVRCIRGINIAL